jgi:endonuclease-3
VKRLSGRLGLSAETDPEKVEQDLMKVVPESAWIEIAHVLILHGRAVCNARKPACARCVVNGWCPSSEV